MNVRFKLLNLDRIMTNTQKSQEVKEFFKKCNNKL